MMKLLLMLPPVIGSVIPSALGPRYGLLRITSTIGMSFGIELWQKKLKQQRVTSELCKALFFYFCSGAGVKKKE